MGRTAPFESTKGDKDATSPLAPRTSAAVEQAVDGRDDGPLLRSRWANRMTRNNDAGAHLRDAHDVARHADPKTTMRYDRNRHRFDRHATSAIAQYISGSE